VCGHLTASEIITSHVLEVLRSVWYEKPETGSRVRSRIERILARATVKGRRSGPNPAAWRGHLQEPLPSPTEVRPLVHYSTMDFATVPAFMVNLCKRKEIGAIALRFLILTAARTGEVIGARWLEVDWQERTWTIPAVRTTTNTEHIVPLSTGAITALREAERLRDVSNGFVFPSTTGRGLSQMALLALLQRRMNYDLTVHGFRSSFRERPHRNPVRAAGPRMSTIPERPFWDLDPVLHDLSRHADIAQHLMAELTNDISNEGDMVKMPARMFELAALAVSTMQREAVAAIAAFDKALEEDKQIRRAA
jgi:integrase